MRLRTASVAALAAAAIVPATAGAQASPDDMRIGLPDGWQPEGIAKAPGGDLYVGSVATGDVLRIDPETQHYNIIINAADGAKANGLQQDRFNRLVVTGNDTGQITVYDPKTGGTVFSDRPAPESAPSFTNDVVIIRGRAYVTDSSRPFVYTVNLKTQEVTSRKLRGVTQGKGVNLNGITTGLDDKSLYTVQSNTGKLFNVGLGSSKVATEVDTGGLSLKQGDGIERRGKLLFVVQNQANRIRVLALSKDGLSAKLLRTITSTDFDVPTTIAFQGGGLYAVNARFGNKTPTTAPYWITSFAG